MNEWSWGELIKVIFAVIGVMVLAYYIILKLVDWILNGYDLDAILKRDLTLKKQNDEISRQVEQSEMPGDNKLEPRRRRWGLGDK